MAVVEKVALLHLGRTSGAGIHHRHLLRRFAVGVWTRVMITKGRGWQVFSALSPLGMVMM